MQTPAEPNLCRFRIMTLLCLGLAGMLWLLPARAESFTSERLLHNSDQFACSLASYLTEADCLAAGGTWDTDRKWTGGWGLAETHYGAIDCPTCHLESLANDNIKMIAPSISAATGSFPGGATVTAHQAVETVSSDFGDDSTTHSSSEKICEVCHSQTLFHRYNATGQVAAGGDLIHFNNADCISCHRHRSGFRADCSDCHGNGETGASWPDGLANNLRPEYASADEAGSHTRHVALLGGNISCDSCHPAPETSGVHLNGTVDLLDSSFSYAAETGTCSSISCHGNTDASWGGTGCLGCHGVVQGARAAVGSQFSANSHHIQGTTVSDANCYACHWEANSDGTIAAAYHGGSSASGSAIDLVVYQAESRPTVYTVDDTAVLYTADGSHTQIEKINGHCLGCHSDQNNAAEPFGDGKTPIEYAWDGTSVDQRYSQTGTTPWGKYTDTTNTDISPKSGVTKAYSAHGDAVANQGGWDLTETWTNTRNGSVNVACFDCHNSHGSNLVGTTTSYISATSNGGILKDTSAGLGGYTVTYAPATGGSSANKNQRKAGASLCMDCHLNASGGTSYPWGYQATFGAAAKILGYYDSPYFAPTAAGNQQRFPYKASTSFAGGHFGASSALDGTPMGAINGLCTPCHDPHGVTPTLNTDQKYGVPLLKGTWLTSPYPEDVAPATNYSESASAWFDDVHYHIDQNTFGSNVNQLVTGITQTPDQFGGLCLGCHPQASLTDGATHTWKSKDRVHESVKGWKTADATVKHNYACSKCHAPHNGASLPRLMVTDCLDTRHKGRVAYQASPVLSETWDECGNGNGQFPGEYDYIAYTGCNQYAPTPREGHMAVSCHEGNTGNQFDQSWNTVTPW